MGNSKPTRRSLIIEAIKEGVQETAKLADLFGISNIRMNKELYDIAETGRIRRAGITPQVNKGGGPGYCLVWEVVGQARGMAS